MTDTTHGDAVRVLSYNVRYDLNAPGRDSWANRKDAVAETIAECAPDIVLLQEVWKGQFADLRERLDGFAWVGPAEGEEHTAVGYRPDRFDLLDSAWTWLAEPETEPGVPGWDSRYPKRFAHARFRDADGTEFDVVDVHVPHTGERAPRAATDLVRRRLTETTGENPVAVAGDINATPDEAVYERWTDSLPACRDLVAASDRADTVAGPDETFTGFPDDGSESKNIDHAFVSPSVAVERVETVVPSQERDDFRPSDHRPVVADLRF
jgi:endonuclease/exonuclease/phosphatase family metal-dependent hydrolase